MNRVRQLMASHRDMTAWWLAAVLLIKLLVPAGYMPMADQGSLRIELCTGYGPERPVAMPAHHGGMQHGAAPHDGGQHGKTQPPCDFSVLGAPGLAGNDMPMLAEPSRFDTQPPVALPARFALSFPAYLRPPSRGPPTI